MHGDGPVTVLLLPPWSIVHSRTWKLQVPYLARHAQVVVYDPRGNGRSDRPSTPSSYDDAELVADAVAVLDAVGVAEAVVVGLSMGGRVLLGLAADHPGRVRGAMFVAPTSCSTTRPDPIGAAFEAGAGALRGLVAVERPLLARDQAGFAEFFFGEVFPEAHSTRQVEDAVAWALETDAETLVATRSPARRVLGPRSGEGGAGTVRCPALVVHGDDDRITPLADGAGPSRRRSGARSTSSSAAATASTPGTRSGSTCGCADSSRR